MSQRVPKPESPATASPPSRISSKQQQQQQLNSMPMIPRKRENWQHASHHSQPSRPSGLWAPIGRRACSNTQQQRRLIHPGETPCGILKCQLLPMLVGYEIVSPEDCEGCQVLSMNARWDLLRPFAMRRPHWLPKARSPLS